MLSSIWDEVSETGIEYAKDESQAKKIRLVNQLAITAVGAEAFMMGVWGASGHLFMTILIIGIMILHSSVLWMTKNGKHYFARSISLSSASLFLFFYSINSGREAGTHLFYYIILVACFACFQADEKKPLYFNVGLVISLYLLLEFYFFPKGALLNLTPWFVNSLYYNHVLLTIIFVVIFLKILSSESDHSEKKLILQNTALQHTRETLYQKQIELEKAIKIRSEFLSNMSHEIRTPLNAIIGFTEIIDDLKLKTQEKEQVQHIKTASSNLLHLVNDILDISKLESENFKLETTNFSISTQIQNAGNLLSKLAKDKGITLEITIHKEFHDIVKGDPFRFHQIVLNLLSNAVKFTNKGNVTCNVKLSESFESTQVVEIKISDTGIGIKTEFLDDIFNNFNQAQSTITREYGGTGLGLTISKKLVGLMHGSIEVESTIGLGSTFTVKIPFEKSIEKIEESAFSMKTTRDDLSHLKVLVVEDNEMNQLLMLQFLKGIKITPDSAYSGQEALNLLRNKKYDLILLDLQMPQMSGFEVFVEMKKETLQDPCIKVIAVTADVFQETKEKALNMGMDQVITKPINKTHLYQEIAINCIPN